MCLEGVRCPVVCGRSRVAYKETARYWQHENIRAGKGKKATGDQCGSIELGSSLLSN